MIANNLLSIVPEKIARKYNVIPIGLENDTLVIGGSKEDIYTIQDLKYIKMMNILNFL